MESNEQNKVTKEKETHRHREQTDSCQRGGVLGGWVKKVKGISKTTTTTTHRHRKKGVALTKWLSCWSLHPLHEKVDGSIPSHGIYLGCGFYPYLSHVQEATDQ